MTRYHVWTDGSAISHAEMRAASTRYPGGWAAVVEHGSDGYTIRGRSAATTNTRMELAAAIEGLRSVPDGAPVTLHSDCTVVLMVLHRWQASQPLLSKDGDLWALLATQYERLRAPGLLVEMVPPGHQPIHRRAHSIAQSEAKSQARGLHPNMTILSRIEKKERRKAALAALPVHQFDCAPGRCVTDCPVPARRQTSW